VPLIAHRSRAPVAELLSEEWFGALAAALDGLAPMSETVDTADGLSLGQIVTGVPDGSGAVDVRKGEVRYTIVLGPGGTASLVRGSTEQADVVLVEDWSTAEAIASGAESVPELLTAGRIKVRGDSRALLAAGELLALVAPVLASALGRDTDS